MRFLLPLFISFFLSSCVVDSNLSRNDNDRSRSVDRKQRDREKNPREKRNKINLSLDVTEEENSQPPSTDKTYTESKPKRVETKKPATPKNFVLPIALLNTETHLLLHSNKERTHVAIKTEPTNRNFKIIAGHKGLVSIDKQILSITYNSLEFMVELKMEHSALSVNKGDRVKQKQDLGVTSKPIIFSVKENGEFIPVCLKITDQTTSDSIKITHTKDQAEDDPCP